MNTKIFEDNILSRNDIAVRYVFQKMFSPQGTLVAVECLSRFDNLSISPEDFFRHATAAVRERIFLEQLALIEKHKAWFLRNHISATINVDDHILNLLRQKDIKAKVAALTCVHFEVTENAENLLHNSLAAWQSPQDTSLGTVAKLAMRQPFVLFKGLTFQKLCLPGAFRPGDHHNKMLRPGLCVVHASPQYL